MQFVRLGSLQNVLHDLAMVRIRALASPEFCSRGAWVRGAQVPKFVVIKSSRSQSHLALSLQNLLAFTNSRGARAPVPHDW